MLGRGQFIYPTVSLSTSVSSVIHSQCDQCESIRAHYVVDLECMSEDDLINDKVRGFTIVTRSFDLE